MKRLIALIAVVMVMVTLVACGKFTCDFCQEKKGGKKYTSDFMGKKITICEDCRENPFQGILN